ncbi:MAG: transcriptional repressor [Candidatus Liptonbacteria bacterium]|nr:transcriptional repressor [Candidatus Liptonbacteria bacterium]
MAKSKIKESGSEFRRMLREHGCKATPPRLLVLELLGKTKEPMSAQALIETLAGKTDQATVYRILKTLKHRGLIRQVDLRHNHAHYELSRGDEHHHLVCNHCGKIEDVRLCDVGATHQAILRHSKHFSKITQHALEFYGVCTSCRGPEPISEPHP